MTKKDYADLFKKINEYFKNKFAFLMVRDVDVPVKRKVNLDNAFTTSTTVNNRKIIKVTSFNKGRIHRDSDINDIIKSLNYIDTINPNTLERVKRLKVKYVDD